MESNKLIREGKEREDREEVMMKGSTYQL